MLSRVLHSFSLGAVIGLGVLATEPDFSLFNIWFFVFLVAAIVLTVRRVQSWRRRYEETQAELAAGTPRAARILRRKRTRDHEGENLEVEFDLVSLFREG